MSQRKPRSFSSSAASVLWVLACAPSALASPGPAAVNETSVFDAFFLPRNPGTGSVELLGALIIWLLLLLSVASIGLIATMAWRNRRSELFPQATQDRVRGLMQKGRFEDAVRLLAEDSSYFGAVLYAGLREASHGFDSMVRGCEQASEEQVLKRLRSIEPLNIIGNVAPMIGLFGTVYGMILAFRAIVSSGGSPDPVELAAGIGTALTTTFWGLVVAIPALAGFGILRNRIDGITLEATRSAEEILGSFRPGGANGGAKRDHSGAA